MIFSALKTIFRFVRNRVPSNQEEKICGFWNYKAPFFYTSLPLHTSQLSIGRRLCWLRHICFALATLKKVLLSSLTGGGGKNEGVILIRITKIPLVTKGEGFAYVPISLAPIHLYANIRLGTGEKASPFLYVGICMYTRNILFCCRIYTGIYF